MDEVVTSSPAGGGEGSHSPAPLIEPQVELNEEFEAAAVESNVDFNVSAQQYALSFYEGADDSTASSSNYMEENMDTSNSEAYDSSCKDDDTNYNEVQRAYLANYFSDYQKGSEFVDDTLDSIDRIPLSRFPSIVKVVERAEYETLQTLYQLLYQRSAWDTQEILIQRILDFSGFKFSKTSEEYYNREMLLQTLPNSTLVKIGAILCLDQVKSVLSNAGLGRHELITAIMEFLALPKKKTRAPRQSSSRMINSNVQPCGCRNYCLGKFTDKEREHILSYFSTLKQKKKQDAYFFNLIKFSKSNTVKKQTPRPSSPDEDTFPAKKSRDYKYHYKVKIGAREMEVCKGAFMILHNLKMTTMNHFQARLRKGCYIAKAFVAQMVCPPMEGEEPPPSAETGLTTTPNAAPSGTDNAEPCSKVPESGPSEGSKEPSKENGSNSTERTEEESKNSSVANSVSNSAEESSESMSSKADDVSSR